MRRNVLRALIATAALLQSGVQRAQSADPFERQRLQMVAQFIESEGVHNPRVLDAMRRVPRHEFVPDSLRDQAYTDAAWSIGHKQTISPPFIVAFMTEVLDPKPSDRVLEVGTGSGYQAAILSLLVKEVYSIEIVEPLARKSRERLAVLGYGNVQIRIGDGSLGWPERAPFDKIIVTCSPESVPLKLVEQLKEGGRMIIPLGERYHQDFFLYEKQNGRLSQKKLIPTLFVPMTGRPEETRTARPDPSHPRIFNGSFEQHDAEGHAAGWHYQRQMKLENSGAPDGKLFARFDNTDPGRLCQVLQGMAIDGRQVKAVRLKLLVRNDEIVDGGEPYQRAGARLYFYNENRQFVGQAGAAHWTDSAPWRRVETVIAVPPEAREAIFCVGLLGATGHLGIDDVRLEVAD